MPTFAGIDHLALSVTDLDRSVRFYDEVLGFLQVLDVGHGRLLLHRRTGFLLTLLRHAGNPGEGFSEQRTGLDHLSLVAADRGELLIWADRLREAGVPCGPVQDEPLGHHLNFRDPDGIALEFFVPLGPYAAALADLRSREVPDDEILARAAQLLARPGT